jgi:broad specificity phosphatase PhoE
MMTHILLRPFYFARHGETDWNKKRIYIGRQDIPLNETGKMQAAQMYHCLKNEKISHIVSSPLKRALQTAEIINKKMQLPLTIIEELQESTFGSAEGKSYGDDTLMRTWTKELCPSDNASRIAWEASVMQSLNKALEMVNLF